MNGLSLCSGIGGLELGIRIATGDGYRCIGYCEQESFAASRLLVRMEETSLDQASIEDDIESLDGKIYSRKVDIVSAGFPCQPWSSAGKQKKTDDERWLWPGIARILREVGPKIVFLENVPGLLDGGIGPVLGDMAEIGLHAEWDVFSACEVGAPHPRERLFILAYSSGVRWDAGRERQETKRIAFPPGPDKKDLWPEDCPKPYLHRGIDGVTERMDRIRTIGNAVVPLAAAYAFRTLASDGGLI